MLTQELIEYIKSQLSQGYDRESIKNALLTRGWNQNDIEEAFSSFNQPAGLVYSDSNLQTEGKNNKNGFKVFLTVIFLFLFSPIGIVLMWLWMGWSKWIKVILSLFLGIPSIIALIILYIFISAKDIPPIDDRDLLLQSVIIQREQNAYYDLTGITKDDFSFSTEDSKKIDDILRGGLWDGQFVDDIISKNEHILTAFETAYNRPKFQDLVYEDPERLFGRMTETSLKLNPFNVISASKLNSLKALQLVYQGKQKEALDQAIKTVEVGQKIQESQSGLINYLLAMAVKKIGLDATWNIISTDNLPPELLINNVQLLEKYKNNKEGLKNAFKIEYLFLSQATEVATKNAPSEVEKIGTSEDIDYKSVQKIPKNDFLFQPNNTKKIFADYFRLGIKAVNEWCGLVKKEDFDRVLPLSSTQLNIGTFLSENVVGKILSKTALSPLDVDSQLTKRCQDELRVSVTQLLFALRAYRSETGDLPLALEELVPKYIPKVFEDPFDGKPIRYSKDKKILYSVGKDLIDSGGSEIGDTDEMPDPSFRIGF